MREPRVPAARDVLIALWELTLQLVVALLSLGGEAGFPKRIVAMFFVAIAATTLAAIKFFDPAFLLLLPLVPATIVFLHARDITRMRYSLELVAHSSTELPPQLSHAELLRSPTVAALHAVAHALRAARRGDAVEVENRASAIEPRYLDASTLRLLTLARAKAALHTGSCKRAAELARDVLPSGDPNNDRELGRCVLREAWRDRALLRRIARAWTSLERPGVLRELTLLISLRLAKSKAWDALLRDVDRPRLDVLAGHARAIDDDAMAERLSARMLTVGPYR